MEERHQKRIHEYEEMIREAMTTAEKDRYEKAKSDIQTLTDTIAHYQQSMAMAQLEMRNVRNSVIERAKLPEPMTYIYRDELRWRPMDDNDDT